MKKTFRLTFQAWIDVEAETPEEASEIAREMDWSEWCNHMETECEVQPEYFECIDD